MVCVVAYCLGFKETAKGTETPYGYLSRRNSDNEFPMDIIWGGGTPEETTPSPTPSTSTSSTGSTGSTKSKNKKKKKKSNKK